MHTEFEDYLKCGLLEYGFLRVRCESCHHERMVAFSCKHRGFCPSCCAKRMTESSALLVDNVLPHQPMRQWVLSFPVPLRFLLARKPNVIGKVLGIVYRAIATYLAKKAIVKLSHQMSLRIARYLERAGLIEKDAENSYLAEGVLSADEMNEHQVYSVHYRIAVGPQKGKKVFALQSLPPMLDDGEGKELLGKMSGFSLHAGMSAKACDRDHLYR